MKKLVLALALCLTLAIAGWMRGSDSFSTNFTGMNFPGYNSAPVTLDDNNDLPVLPRAIYVTSGGDMVLELQNDTPGVGTTFGNVPSGTLLSLRVRRVHATGTTARGIVAVW